MEAPSLSVWAWQQCNVLRLPDLGFGVVCTGAGAGAGVGAGAEAGAGAGAGAGVYLPLPLLHHSCHDSISYSDTGSSRRKQKQSKDLRDKSRNVSVTCQCVEEDGINT